jgi:ubiquinone/menaquinone biosynthesis C-methylase UbiE
VTTWWPDETAWAGAEHLDAAYVAGYEAKSGYDPSADLEALRQLGLGPASVVVDLAAGTGVFATAVASRCRRVIAVDVSPAMTAVLRAKRAALGLENLSVVDAGFLSYVHDGEPADFVFCRNALHQVPDFWKGIALGRIHDLLRPGGVLRVLDLVFDFDPAEAGVRIASWLAGAVEDPARGFTAAELETHVRTEYSTYTWLFDALLERTGFSIVERSTRRSAYATYTCRRG